METAVRLSEGEYYIIVHTAAARPLRSSLPGLHRG